MKLTINKLIANDIINYGMDQTSSFNYIVGLDDYLKDFEDDSKIYILENLNSICDDISNNERIADFFYDEKAKEFNMVFYWEFVLNDKERIILENAKLLNVNLEFEDIKELADTFDNEVIISDDLINEIKNYDKGNDLQ